MLLGDHIGGEVLHRDMCGGLGLCGVLSVLNEMSEIILEGLQSADVLILETCEPGDFAVMVEDLETAELDHAGGLVERRELYDGQLLGLVEFEAEHGLEVVLLGQVVVDQILAHQLVDVVLGQSDVQRQVADLDFPELDRLLHESGVFVGVVGGLHHPVEPVPVFLSGVHVRVLRLLFHRTLLLLQHLLSPSVVPQRAVTLATLTYIYTSYYYIIILYI